jgi:hypothetical protein
MAYNLYGSPTTDMGGLPDLIVELPLAPPTEMNGLRYLEFTVKNVGGTASPSCMIYLNGVSLAQHPGVNDIREQRSFLVGPIAPGGSVSLGGGFSDQAITTGEISIYEILVDAKVQVAESDELNNAAYIHL